MRLGCVPPGGVQRRTSFHFQRKMPAPCKRHIDVVMEDNPWVIRGEKFMEFKDRWPSDHSYECVSWTTFWTIRERAVCSGELSDVASSRPSCFRQGHGIRQLTDLFMLIVQIVDCSNTHIKNGAIHGAIHGTIWYLVANSPGPPDWELLERLHPMAFGDVSHGIGWSPVQERV